MRFHLDDLLGNHSALEWIRRRLPDLAHSRLPILVHGETGSGKTMLAEIIHDLSECDGPYVHLDCGSMVEDLVANELFGHMRGSFTSADRTQLGLIERAAGGTLFLDELGNLSLPAQTKLLQVLDERRFRRVGSTEEIEVDVRVVGASSQPLQSYVDEGRFRKDLYFRLKGVSLHLPPLRERREDILPLFQHYLGHYCRERGRKAPRLTSDAREVLQNYPWPGNVRELLRLAEELAWLHGLEYLTAADLVAHEISTVCCWHVRHCVREDCPAYGNVDYRCWLHAGTLGPDGCPRDFPDKAGACLHCEVFARNCAAVQGRNESDRARFLAEQVRAWCSERPAAVLPDGGVRIDRMSFRLFRDQVVGGSIRQYLASLLSGCEGNVEEACRVSELSRSSLYQLLRQHGLRIEEFRENGNPGRTVN